MNDSDFHVFSLAELSFNNTEEAIPQLWQLKKKKSVEEIQNFILKTELVASFNLAKL